MDSLNGCWEVENRSGMEFDNFTTIDSWYGEGKRRGKAFLKSFYFWNITQSMENLRRWTFLRLFSCFRLFAEMKHEIDVNHFESDVKWMRAWEDALLGVGCENWNTANQLREAHTEVAVMKFKVSDLCFSANSSLHQVSRTKVVVMSSVRTNFRIPIKYSTHHS